MKTKPHTKFYGAYAKYLKLKRDGGIAEVNRSVPQHLQPQRPKSRVEAPNDIDEGTKSRE
jgi:hypothetical protein